MGQRSPAAGPWNMGPRSRGCGGVARRRRSYAEIALADRQCEDAAQLAIHLSGLPGRGVAHGAAQRTGKGRRRDRQRWRSGLRSAPFEWVRYTRGRVTLEGARERPRGGGERSAQCRRRARCSHDRSRHVEHAPRVPGAARAATWRQALHRLDWTPAGLDALDSAARPVSWALLGPPRAWLADLARRSWARGGHHLDRTRCSPLSTRARLSPMCSSSTAHRPPRSTRRARPRHAPASRCTVCSTSCGHASWTSVSGGVVLRL